MKNIEKLIHTLAARLKGQWFVNDKMKAQKGHECVFYLHDRKGIFLTFSLYEYGKNLPQIKLGFFNTRYNHVYNIEKIGCSLDKGITSIVNDIESRLLVELPKAQERYEEEKKQREQQLTSKEQDSNIIHALSCVYGLFKYSCYSNYPTYEFNDLDIVFKHLGGDDFQVKLNSISLDKLIRIAQIVAEP